MKLFAISMLMLWASVAYADQPVTFTASDAFSVIPTATGSIRNDGTFLTVMLDRFTLRTSDKFKVPQRITGYRICLVKNIGNGQWDFVRSSSTVAASYTITPGQTQSIPGYKAEIPIDGLQSLRGDWLVIAVDVQGSGPAGVVYAHSQNWKAP